jgi:hypothetical protein
MKVSFDPSNYQPTGVVSFLSWSNQDFLNAMRAAFHESPRERIIELVVEKTGIKAVFETR